MITIAIILVAITFAVIGWYARGQKEEFDRDLDKVFYEALKGYES